jgi:Flp pilus assembly protein TadG
MRKALNMKTRPYKQSGASIVHWLIALGVLLGFGALAIDMNNLYLSKSQLHIAADAGALEGARLLYNADGEINVGQSGISAVAGATQAAQANNSQGVPVEVVSVNRGHWEFMTTTQDANGIERGGEFTANPTTTPADLVDADGNFRTFQDLNQDPDEINAIEVVTARQLTPVQAIFGRLLGIDEYQVQARSVAYVGFAGTILPGEIDTPIAMCREVLTQGCDVARLVPSPDQTGGWTNLETFTPNTCSGASNASELRSLVEAGCDGEGINNTPITLGDEIQVNNGQVNSAFTDLYNCWRATAGDDDWPTQPMILNMPVVDGCRFGGDCATVIGAIRVELLWMFLNNPDSSGRHGIDNTAPREMEDWTAPVDDGIGRWNSFVEAFGLLIDSNPDIPATWENGGAVHQTMYFRPSCTPIELGETGGANYGVRAAVPVLVH